MIYKKSKTEIFYEIAKDLTKKARIKIPSIDKFEQYESTFTEYSYIKYEDDKKIIFVKYDNEYHCVYAEIIKTYDDYSITYFKKINDDGIPGRYMYLK